jgi:excisionase family DNA binding protein
MTRTDGLPHFLTPEEAASVLRTSKKAIYVMVDRKKIPGIIRIGRRLLIRTSTLLDWLNQQGSSLGEQR